MARTIAKHTKMKKETFMQGVITLIFSQVLVKLLGLVYTLYLTNREGFGDKGNGIVAAGYKNNPEKLNQETIELYKTEKMSPFSGCLTSILQLVIILSVFWLVRSEEHTSELQSPR